jgi:hypothetical protein
VVRPADDASRFSGQGSQRESGERGEPPFDRGLSPGIVDDIKMLVEPDRNLWAEASDQPIRDTALGF